jgi:hypothetical protein
MAVKLGGGSAPATCASGGGSAGEVRWEKTRRKVFFSNK